MKSIKYIVVFVLISFFIFSCQKNDTLIEEEEIVSSLLFRVENATEVKFDSIISNNYFFGTLESGEISDYVELDAINQWPNISCQHDEKGYLWDCPIDAFSFWAATYTEGNYTLVITGFADSSPLLIDAYVKED